MTDERKKELIAACEHTMRLYESGTVLHEVARALKAELSRPEAPLPEEVREIAQNIIRNGGISKDYATHALDVINPQLVALAQALIKSSPPRLTEKERSAVKIARERIKAWPLSEKMTSDLIAIIDRLSQGEAPPSPERLPGGTHMSRYKTAEDYERIAEARAQGEAPPAVGDNTPFCEREPAITPSESLPCPYCRSGRGCKWG